MRKATPFTLLVLGALMALPGATFAQESAAVPNSMAPKNVRGIIEDIRAKRNDIKVEIKDTRRDIKKESSELREDTKAKMSAATSSAERRAIEKSAIEQRKEIISERKASTTALKEKRNALQREHLQAITKRYWVAIKQFENLAARIQSRIDKMQGAGVDTSTAESALGTARSAIAQVKTDVQAVRDLLSQAETAADPGALREQVAAGVKKAGESVKSAHKALQTAAKTLVTLVKTEKSSLKSSRGEASGERPLAEDVPAATSTGSNN